MNKLLYHSINDKNTRLATYDIDKYQHTCSTTIINGILYSIRCLQANIMLLSSNIFYSVLQIIILFIIIPSNSTKESISYALYGIIIILMFHSSINSICIFMNFINDTNKKYYKILGCKFMNTYCCESGLNWYIMRKCFNDNVENIDQNVYISLEV